MGWVNQIITGADNQTVAIGRVLGIIVAVLFLVFLPSAAVVSIGLGWISADSWQVIFTQLTTYEPAIALSIAGLIGLTAFSEPKGADKDAG
jgi:hypothetical protein